MYQTGDTSNVTNINDRPDLLFLAYAAGFSSSKDVTDSINKQLKKKNND